MLKSLTQQHSSRFSLNLNFIVEVCQLRDCFVLLCFFFVFFSTLEMTDSVQVVSERLF